MIEIYNTNCLELMGMMKAHSVDVVLTSPFYNTNKKSSINKTLMDLNTSDGNYPYLRYDTPVDIMTNDEYNQFTVNLFTQFDKILQRDGVILYNMSYGNENTEGLFLAISHILIQTNFTIGDVIVWKKKNAMPNNCSHNRLTRIWEFVFVFCRKSEAKSFFMNKNIVGYRKTGQASYENIFNFIEAKNNDGTNPLNKATFSSDLCIQLLKWYAPKDATVYDPFIGTGTTAVACLKLGLNCIGSEISAKQCEYAKSRIADVREKLNEI